MSDFYYPGMETADAMLATLAYYDGFKYPLTAFELYRYLINPQRLRPHVQGLEPIALRDIHEGLDVLIRQDSIVRELGFYALKGRTGLGALRLDREKIAAQKWRLCLRRAYWLQVAPWIRGMFASGSLAMGTVSEGSDFDMLVLVEPGRLYLARLFLSGIASVIGARRTRFETVAPDKFCFNHYITLNALSISHESLYNAQTYAHLVPISIHPTLAGEFFVANLWINKFVYNFTPHQQVIRRAVKKSTVLRGIARSLEIFMNPAGNVMERWAREYQQKRIAANPATHAPGGRVIYTTTELEFHPHSFERVILDHHNTITKELRVAMSPEPDSGLKQ